MYRLPIGVDCSSNQGKVRISGPCRVVFFVLPASYIVKVLYIYIFIFLKIDTIALYNYTFTHAVLSVILGYTIELNLKGIGCRVGKEKGKLIFNLGYNHSVF